MEFRATSINLTRDLMMTITCVSHSQIVVTQHTLVPDWLRFTSAQVVFSASVTHRGREV